MKIFSFGMPRDFATPAFAFKMTVLAVNRNGVFRFYKGIDQLQFLLTGMSRYMGVLEDHFCAFRGQLVDDSGNGLSHFPGMGLELKMIVSLGWIVTFRCTSAAILERAAMDSPWLPVVISTIFSGG